MAELRRAEKLASAKKKLRQFQQKNRDSQSESGRSTPSKKKSEEEDSIGKLFRSENGGSSNSLSQSENFSSNISGTDSPVPALENHLEVSQIFNGSSQPDILNVGNMFNSSQNESKSFFQTPSPQHLFSEALPPSGNKSAAEFFDNLASSYESSDVVGSSFRREVAQMPPPLLNMNMTGFNSPHINASTPDGPLFQDTPNYSFPDASVSPIKEPKNDTSRDIFVGELEQKLQQKCARITELEAQVSEQKTHIIQLQTHLEELKKKADEGISALKHHVQAIEILVSEKTELQNNLDKKQEELNVKNGELEELQGRLRASRHRVTELERDLGTSRAHAAVLEGSVSQLTSRLQAVSENNDALRKNMGDLELEVSDLRSKLENGERTVSALQAELAEKTSQLSLAHVRIEQLSSGPGSDSSVVEHLQAKNKELSRAVESLEAQLSSAATTQEQSVRDYQRYVERLQQELQQLKAQEEAAGEQVARLTTREQQLVQQVGELERQLNRAPAGEDPALRELRERLARTSDAADELRAQLAHKSNEVDCLREGLQERALRIQELEATIERLEAERPDSANLQAAIESDKVAASRAVAQNNNLKKQLEELQEALVKLSNSKLELTQKLQHEQHLSKDLSEKLERIQDSKPSNGEVVEEKCLQTETPIVQEAEVQTNDSQPVVSPEAMAKLEEKFRRKMDELANLSDEKQRLEHLVLQLQSETETIGEYITLYQIQRGMLRQRAQEKDEQVARLAQDKEALRNKLAQLNSLVQQLVGGGCTGQHHLNGYESELPEGVNSSSVPAVTTQDSTGKVETAEKIQSLLTEIGSSNLVTSATDTNINFHPCPWCSGRLITV